MTSCVNSIGIIESWFFCPNYRTTFIFTYSVKDHKTARVFVLYIKSAHPRDSIKLETTESLLYVKI